MINREHDLFEFLCPKCGATCWLTIAEFEDEPEENDCDCGNVGDWMPLNINPVEFKKLSQEQKDKHIQHILNLTDEEYIEQKKRWQKWKDGEEDRLLKSIESEEEIPAWKRNRVICPYCKSTNVEKIGTIKRSVSVGLFGLASKKIGKQWHCNNCKSDF